jgi:hypothetical protein
MAIPETLDYGLIPVIEVANILFGQERGDRTSGDERHLANHGGLFVNTKKNRWYCHGESKGGDAIALIQFATGCDFKGALDWLRSQGFQSYLGGAPCPQTLVETYDYVDASGNVVYSVDRYKDPKSFRQWREIDGERVNGVSAGLYERSKFGGPWYAAKNGPHLNVETREFPAITPVPYRLPELIQRADRAVLIPGGEKDVDNLRALGFTATCNHGGEGKWYPELTPYFKDRRVFLLLDNDRQGEKHQEVVGAALNGVAAEIRVVRFPELPEDGDVSDLIERRRKDGLDTLAIRNELAERFRDEATAWEPAPEPAQPTPAPNVTDEWKPPASVTEDIAGDLSRIDDLIERDRRIKEAAQKHGVSVGVIKAEIARRTKKASVTPIRVAPKADMKALEASADAIINSENVLETFEKAWLKVAAGEAKNAKLLYLCGTSRVFGTCMNAAIKGPSSCGKSVLRGRVLDFFPPESVISFTTLSEKALLYYKDDFCHKILSMGEASGAEEQELQDYLLRELMSEGRLIYPVVQKIGEELVTTNIEKNGPVAFQVTTTKAALHPENETRMISIDVDDSEEQTSLVLGKVAQIVGMNAEAATIDFEPWRDFQRWLAAGNCSVFIPFADRLAALIPPRSVRLRRDFGQILLAIKAHALLHRNRRKVDARGQIVAEIGDYRVVAELMGAIVSEASGTGVGKELQETIDAVKAAKWGRGR